MLRSLVACAVLSFVIAVVGGSTPARAQSIDNYLGKKASVPQSVLGTRAKLYDRHFNLLASPGPNDVVVWQNPLPGDAFAVADDAKFIVTDKVPVPEVVGMRVGDAELLLSYRGLLMSVVDDCSVNSKTGPAEDQKDDRVSQQCVAPGTLFDPGNYVGVVIEPWPESAMFWVMGGIAAAAAALALAFFLRGRFLNHELDVFKTGRNPPS